MATPSFPNWHLQSMSKLTVAQRLEIVDGLEKAFNECTHPHARQGQGWCNLCGAQRMGDAWLRPHYRDIILSFIYSAELDE